MGSQTLLMLIHSSENVSVVHNGIIENSDQLKKELEDLGLKFKSQTDTEVITINN